MSEESPSGVDRAPGGSYPSASTAAPPLGSEVASLRTTYSRTYRAESGTETTRLFDEPVNFPQADGTFRRIDNTLTDSSLDGYEVRNGANAYRAELPETLEDPVRFQVGDRWLRFSLRGADAAAQIDGRTVTYADVAPGVDAEYEMLGRGLKETLVLASAAANGPFIFDLHVREGITPQLEAGGRVEFRDGEHVIFAFDAPFMADAAGATSNAVDVALDRQGDSWKLILTPSPEWLGDSGRQFPVRLDPTVSWGWPSTYIKDGPADTYVDRTRRRLRTQTSRR